MKTRWGLEVPEILVDPLNTLQCVRAIGRPEYFGLRRLGSDEIPREYDVVYCAERNYQRHVGIAVDTIDGLMVMHCQQSTPVCLHPPAELLARVFKSMTWLRFTALEEARTCA
ncbi:hypothetical protein LJC59_01055 [Desulfovibrio sp. OttesenSCG-928-A18]|nr:hypothetical protein [Desulfovibrio sp. OttesenSCG-928-A18]